MRCPLVERGVPHGPHPYLPLVPDPRDDRVFHLLVDAALVCDGTEQ